MLVNSSITTQHGLDGGDGPLYLWTNTSLGTDDEITIFLDPGVFRIKFAATQFQYKIEHCTYNCSSDGWYCDMEVQPSTMTTEKTWTLAKSEMNLVVWCDGVVTVN